MAFAINLYDVPYVETYGEAKQFLETASQRWRGRFHNSEAEYPMIGKHRQRNAYGVRMRKDGSVAFRYQYTDVATWHPDGSVTFDVKYNSRSTNIFATNFAPPKVFFEREATVVQLHNTYWPVGTRGIVHIKRGAQTIDTDTLFSRDVVNREGAKRVLADTNYAEYRKWHKVMLPLLIPQDGRYHRASWLSMSPLKALEDQDMWPDLLRSAYGRPDYLRDYIYQNHAAECFERADYRSLPTFNEKGNATDLSKYYIVPQR